MIKVVELTEEEIAKIKRKSKLAQIARNLVGEDRVNNGAFILIKNISQPNYPILIDDCDNKIKVANPHYIPRALQLAYAFEDETGEEFTIKRNYIEE